MNTEMIVVPVFFGMLGFVIWVVVNGWQRRQQVKVMTDFNSRLFDRLGSAKDFNDLLQSEGGARLIAAMTAERGSTGARDRILQATQMGVVFVVLGLGFLFLHWRHCVVVRNRPAALFGCLVLGSQKTRCSRHIGR